MNYLICIMCTAAAMVVLHTFEHSFLMKILLLPGIVVVFATSAQTLLRFHPPALAPIASHHDTEAH